jgi:hypothetical protein
MNASLPEWTTYYVTRTGYWPTVDALLAAGSYEAMVAAARLLEGRVYCSVRQIDGWVSYSEIRDGQPPLEWAVGVRDREGLEAARRYHANFKLGDPPPKES